MISELHDERPRQTLDVRLEQRPQDTLVVAASGDTLLSMNDTALALWELCDGTNTVDEIVAAVVSLFHADAAEIRSDVVRTLERLRDVGAVDLHGA